ncbi:hypothetical protein MPSI1_000672 [Malassezia psittaci]|uniref:F-box domain-containing protein n=1 Tax=Malassezia psittaci TaxID=1821823 RepID=A0AAF0F6Z9_9BASI|nr:hypothetical protein MPSI1_000672 [Malassezia psittaci]
MEVALHILGFLRDPKALTSAASVSKTWRKLANDEYIWGNLCSEHGYALPSKLHWLLNTLLPLFDDQAQEPMQEDDLRYIRHSPSSSLKGAFGNSQYRSKHSTGRNISLRHYYRLAYLTEKNWLSSGRLLSIHVTDELADADPDPNRRLAITCCAIDANYIVVGMTKRTVYVFSTRTGKLLHVLDQHESGVWCLMLAAGTHPTTSARSDMYQAEGLRRTYLDRTPSAQLSLSDDPKDHGLALQEVMDNAQLRDNAQDAVLGHTPGWGYPDTILVSAGSDRNLRTWNMRTGECEHVLKGHTSTIRCVQVLKGRPLAVSGSRDGTLRVWDLEHGRLVHVLAGHQHSVRCLDTAGNRVASGSYDFTCRIWDVDTGQCLHVLKGHHLQIYAIAFDGRYVVAGSSDSTVRVWDAETGACLAVFQGYTHVVAQLQLYNDVLASGSGDGRVIVFSLKTFECLYRLCAHDSSVSTLQMNDKFLVTGGADGLVKLWDAQSGRYIP